MHPVMQTQHVQLPVIEWPALYIQSSCNNVVHHSGYGFVWNFKVAPREHPHVAVQLLRLAERHE
jgi:hypothetical protein